MAPRSKGAKPGRQSSNSNKKSIDPVDDSPEGLLQQYAQLIDQLGSHEYDRTLHEQHVALATKMNDDDAIEQSWSMLATYFPLRQHEWQQWIAFRKQQLSQQADSDDMTKHVELLELLQRATKDYLSIDLLKEYTSWMTTNYFSALALTPPSLDQDEQDDQTPMNVDVETKEANPILSAVFSLEQVREACKEIIVSGGNHLAQSHLVWNPWRDFELQLLKLSPTPEQLEYVDKFFLERLAIPHTDMDNTFASYSTFVTQYRNDDYGTLLPAANKVYGVAKQKMNEREEHEANLKRQGNTEHAYLEYIAWEREVKKPDITLTTALLERAISDHPTSLELWETMVDFAGTVGKKAPLQLQACERAVRSLPGSATIWAAYMRAAEKNASDVDVDELYQRALATKLFDKELEQLVILVEARAGYHRREIDEAVPAGAEAENPELAEVIVLVIIEGIELTKKAKKGGDPQLRLEKYLVRIFERFGRLEEAANVWNSITESNPNSYAAWYGHADFETRRNNIPRAHEIYSKGCSAKGLDYPEYLLEAWLTFEKQNGNLADLEYSMNRIKRQKKGLERKRYREAMEAAAKAQQQQAAAAAADSFISNAVGDQSRQQQEISAVPTDDVSVVADKKRERSEVAGEEEGQSAKKARMDEADTAMSAPAASTSSNTVSASSAPVAHATSEDVKRDRENATVFVVAPTATNMTEDDLHRLFRDCGEIREMKLKTFGDKSYAMVEFTERETVLPARTKDKKRIHDQEIDVHVAARACLYVTNFPESYDKAAVEKLFSQFGVVFDTRWPSKRFKSTRRFCYIQYTSPEQAQAALSLHNSELEGHKISVLISDPTRKKERTDVGANDKELYIAGLAKSTKEDDLRALFGEYGQLKGVRVPVDDKGLSKGFAFIEYDDEASAQAALALNNHELKKRHISVTIAQARARGTQPNAFDKPKESKSSLIERSIRVKGLPADTEEAIIQQEIEKLVPNVKQILFEQGSSEAVVELENAADAGKLLILASTTAIKINDVVVELSAQGRQPRIGVDGRTQSRNVNSSGGAGGASDAPLMPRQAQRGRGRLGLGMRGRGGLGRGGASAAFARAASAGSSSGAAPSAITGGTTEKAAGKSQNDFRALLNKK
ncbi:Splicing factor [Microbotryomycetes sp. JL221]|nr:Splicing factor [Microbotryomycetes sp. JL221]